MCFSICDRYLHYTICSLISAEALDSFIVLMKRHVQVVHHLPLLNPLESLHQVRPHLLRPLHNQVLCVLSVYSVVRFEQHSERVANATYTWVPQVCADVHIFVQQVEDALAYRDRRRRAISPFRAGGD